jgi:hypothetical protein
MAVGLPLGKLGVGFDWFLILLLDIKLSMTQKMIQKTADFFNGTGGLNKAFWLDIK